MSNLIDFAMSELTKAGLFDEESDYNGDLGRAVIELIEVFARQGHSGFSAGMVSNLFNNLSRYNPITPLTGEEDEWVIIGNGLRQNKRCSHVFEQNGQAYDSNGKVFREPNGVCYTSKESHVPISFPYTPKCEYVDVPLQTEKDE